MSLIDLIHLDEYFVISQIHLWIGLKK